MNRKEAIEAIKNNTKLLSFLFKSEEVKVEKFEAVKVKDGDQLVEVQGELAPGTQVITSSANGSATAPDGQYDLEDGSSFIVKDGVVSEVLSEASNSNDNDDFDSEDKSDEDMADAVPSDDDSKADSEDADADDKEAEADAANTAGIQALTEKVTELVNAVNAINQALEGKADKADMSKMAEAFTSINKAFEVLAETPQEFSKVDNSNLYKDSKVKQMEAFVSALTKKQN